eukprot:GFYU01008760.1.p1 GENE.GFYU01008760.1~~GFYU01008760.1.p1  ORF type:complete len:360 (-),score=82.41 GFYU01008760.1:851-1876(-)
MYYTVELGLTSLHPDWLSDEWVQKMDAKMETVAAEHKDNPNLIGYFTANEVIWGSIVDRWPVEIRVNDTKLVEYLNFNTDTAGHKAAVEFLTTRYDNDISKLNSAWRIKADSFATVGKKIPFLLPSAKRSKDYEAFLSHLATTAFERMSAVIRKHDPNHLIMGCRYSFWEMPDVVIKAEGPHVDIMSYNGYIWYPFMDVTRYVNNIHSLTSKPVIISEFAFRAFKNQSKDPNTKGAGIPVVTQGQRVSSFESYAHKLMSLPVALGYHWFQYSDEPSTGRFDGENSNFGIVDVQDNPYVELTNKMKEVADSLHSIHAAGANPWIADTHTSIPEATIVESTVE